MFSQVTKVSVLLHRVIRMLLTILEHEILQGCSGSDERKMMKKKMRYLSADIVYRRVALSTDLPVQSSRLYIPKNKETSKHSMANCKWLLSKLHVTTTQNNPGVFDYRISSHLTMNRSGNFTITQTEYTLL